MRVTSEELQQIIKEELTAVLDEKKGKKTKASKKKKRKKKKAKKSAAKKDACYNKVKSRYKVWPSAYASGALVKCRNVGAKNWGNSTNEEVTPEEEEELKDVAKQLDGAVKAHAKQSKTIKKTLKKEEKKNCGCGQDPCKTYGK